jgi:hypothetical protein
MPRANPPTDQVEAYGRRDARHRSPGGCRGVERVRVVEDVGGELAEPDRWLAPSRQLPPDFGDEIADRFDIRGRNVWVLRPCRRDCRGDAGIAQRLRSPGTGLG